MTRFVGRSVTLGGAAVSLCAAITGSAWGLATVFATVAVFGLILLFNAGGDTSFATELREMGFARSRGGVFFGRVGGLELSVRERDGSLGRQEASVYVALDDSVRLESYSEEWRVAFGAWLRCRLFSPRGFTIRVEKGAVSIIGDRDLERGPSFLLATLAPVLDGIRIAHASPARLLEDMALCRTLGTPHRLAALGRMTGRSVTRVAALLDEKPVLAIAAAKRLGFHATTEAAMLRVLKDPQVPTTDRIDAVSLLGAWGSREILGLSPLGGLPLVLAVERAARKVRNELRDLGGQLSIAGSDDRGGLALADDAGALSLQAVPQAEGGD
jgi:hypothetical protein